MLWAALPCLVSICRTCSLGPQEALGSVPQEPCLPTPPGYCFIDFSGCNEGKDEGGAERVGPTSEEEGRRQVRRGTGESCGGWRQTVRVSPHRWGPGTGVGGRDRSPDLGHCKGELNSVLLSL